MIAGMQPPKPHIMADTGGKHGPFSTPSEKY